jgi:hypothetical protein
VTSHTNDHETQGMDRRDFLRTSAAGIAAAGAAAAGLATTAASAKTVIPGEPLKTNATKGGKRVIVINDALLQIGPPLGPQFRERPATTSSSRSLPKASSRSARATARRSSSSPASSSTVRTTRDGPTPPRSWSMRR